MKKFKGALGIGKKKANKHIRFLSDDQSIAGRQRNHGSDAMSVDQASQESREATIHILTSDEKIILVDDHER